MSLAERMAAALGVASVRLSPLHGGCVAEVYRVDGVDGIPRVAKVDPDATGHLVVEARMLTDLAPHLPVPGVLFVDDGLLLMEFVPGGQGGGASVEEDAAALLANLHGVTDAAFGYGYDTLIGALPQPNPRSERWVPFFAEHRLAFMASLAHERGQLPTELRRRVMAFAERLDGWLEEPAKPALLHGDIWSGNVLTQGGRVAGFVDPAIYFGHPEIELAFLTMFSTFGQRFFERYAELRPIAPGFLAERRDTYNLYPNLVHVALFGGSYVAAVDAILRRFGG